MIETLTCTVCGDPWEREAKRGRKPPRCPKCQRELQESKSRRPARPLLPCEFRVGEPVHHCDATGWNKSALRRVLAVCHHGGMWYAVVTPVAQMVPLLVRCDSLRAAKARAS